METIIRFFDKVAFVALVCMLFVVVSSVLGRLVFDISGGELQLVMPGSVELASYSLLIMVFASLPRAATHGLVSVELLLDKLPDLLKRVLERIWHLLLAAFAAVIGWLFFGTMVEMIDRGDRSQDLGIPLYLFYGALTVCCVAIVLTGLWLARHPQRPVSQDD
ncbi:MULTISPECIES: TRAP transporter small permease [unclassified Oceanobacter]|uniref:TRAP transporter small permease n=1 Tax=unclassified Oceanobacter TaxID=2620260 RepID=UPI0026E1841A|nr:MULTISPECIES: TRAP transporter small permease subunit [unclassified Oceanobacter]MDO6680725.1 TRAP transporter small permease subunit [Oceanobacter sp. 5_MG-2023]MDP2504493.1 TRAP transporter small permease subunit [Oceanobacter sp. 3_MG-2023]MDP2547053.1 TRAP transporter small permease subunit [Oceanobacter sp. 4_MG-2023]MDP2607877.1 TRAP transporter small permease subunit [Oceanobacter sp. 1_MG-2023]MDP2610939.1 TRAP transporter small permease subunit [Oceanobacter sp. 2_MG-2023]